MFTQSIFGNTPNCPNRLCGQKFYKESFLGWSWKSEMQVFVTMRCPKCKDTFMIGQMASTTKQYVNRLPSDPELAKRKKAEVITSCEITEFHEKMEKDPNPLRSLFDGPRPDTPNYGFHEQ